MPRTSYIYKNNNTTNSEVFVGEEFVLLVFWRAVRILSIVLVFRFRVSGVLSEFFRSFWCFGFVNSCRIISCFLPLVATATLSGDRAY